MTLCRTCLSKSDLKPIFSDKNLASSRSKQLILVCGIKIELDDGLPQLICGECSNLVNSALKLREQSSKAEEILIKTFTTIKIEYDHTDSQISQSRDSDTNLKHSNDKKTEKECHDLKMEQEKSKNSKDNREQAHENINLQKPDQNDIPVQNDIDKFYTVRIEDYESSNDSDFVNSYLINDEPIQSEDESRKVRIEDFESSDSLDQDFRFVKKEPKIENNYRADLKYRLALKEKQLLERERKKLQFKELDQKLLSLAATPYDSGGPIRCTLCNKEVRNLQNFKCHAKTHFEPKNACEECGKKFVNPSHLRYHQQRVHGRRKRLACSKCAYRAVDHLQLQNHVRAEHTGERPFICDVCGVSFRMRANIVQHMRKHFGVRNLQCERCPAMFRSRSELSGHQNRVHFLVYTYLCYLCPETYKRPASVKKHLANVHRVPEDQQLPIKCIKVRKDVTDK